jgi:hypothetical protein
MTTNPDYFRVLYPSMKDIHLAVSRETGATRMSFAEFITLPAALWRVPFQLAFCSYAFLVQGPEVVGGRGRPPDTCRIMPNCQSRAIQPVAFRGRLRYL